jgi:uncharacterized protein
MSVPARISIVTLGVDDLPQSKAFYEALGWEIAGSAGDEICWFRTADSYLGLYEYAALAQDANLSPNQRPAFSGFTVAICVDSDDAVASAIEQAAGAGAEVLKPAQKAAEFEGFHGYFADPDGYAWEVANNPNFPIGDDGRITIP